MLNQTTMAQWHNRQVLQKSAIQDPMYAIENHPTSAADYVTACDIYVMQGAVLTAMEILKSGLRSVPPTEQALLYDRLAMIKKILGPRIDFMEKLPAEIVVNIFVRLEKDMVLINCTTVSKRWRYILLQQCPELWRTAIIDRHLSPRQPPSYCPWLPTTYRILNCTRVTRTYKYRCRRNQRFERGQAFA
ncbi:hypothetical protein BJV82DRAFT_283961 [Fennellomyces sp. T-0311]|nr:hypothetical protein BJV82DRAFT_283961 [Fennellomyces sp. T-0311]